MAHQAHQTRFSHASDWPFASGSSKLVPRSAVAEPDAGAKPVRSGPRRNGRLRAWQRHGGVLMAKTMVDYIARDLRSRIQTGADLPHSLTLSSLSQLYRVSTTPVRQAVSQLVEENLLIRQDGGRLSINPARTQTESSLPVETPPSRPLDVEDWEATLAPEIIRMSLQGESVYLREEATSARLGIGRTVVRGIFGRLAGKGLLEHLPRRGWRVATVRRIRPRRLPRSPRSTSSSRPSTSPGTASTPMTSTACFAATSAQSTG